MRKNEKLLIFLSLHLLEAATETPNVVDTDVRDALDGLVHTYKTMQSGLYYQSRPANILAASIFERIQSAVDELRKASAGRPEMTVRDLDILGTLIFLQRMEIQQNNGRKLGRAFIDFLRAYFPANSKPAESSPLIV